MLGKMPVRVQYGDQVSDLTVHVVAGEGPDLFGRDWMSRFGVTLDSIHALDAEPSKLLLKEVLCKHPDLFSEELGCLQGMKVQLHVDPEAKPRFFKPRTVAYALREGESGGRARMSPEHWCDLPRAVLKLGCTHCAC